MPKERTEETDAVVDFINNVGDRVSTYRKGQLTMPIVWKEERKIYAGFWSDYDNGCMDLYFGLLKHGFRSSMYRAPYHWKLKNPEETIELAYIEGDLHAIVL